MMDPRQRAAWHGDDIDTDAYDRYLAAPEGYEARQVERNDSAREAGEGEREEELPGPAQPAERPSPALLARVDVGNAIPIEELRSILVVQAGIGLRSI